MPEISVIVPNYNHAPYLRQRIDSILNQTYQDFELILLDDCSTDNSKEILNNYAHSPHVSHIVFNEHNSGSPFKQWEKGMKLAKGRYIWIAESDDYADPLFLERTAACLFSYSDCSFCYTCSTIVNAEGQKIEDLYCNKDQIADGKIHISNGLEFIKEHMVSHNSVYNASMVLFRKQDGLEVIKHVIGMKYVGDWFFWILMAAKGNVVELRERLNYFRQHKSNTTDVGSRSGDSADEIIQIRQYLYRNYLPFTNIMIDRCLFYRYLRGLHVPSNKKRQLYKKANQLAGINFWTYVIGKYIDKWINHK